MNSGKEQKITLPNLNLPHFEPNLRWQEDKLWIRDVLRKKYLSWTPEEWVRQHWIHFLIQYHEYPKGLFSLEKGLKYNQLQKRTDLVVFDRLASPYLLVECKAPNVPITNQTLAQALSYNSVLHCPNVILTNGINHFYMVYSDDEKKFIEQKNVPRSPK